MTYMYLTQNKWGILLSKVIYFAYYFTCTNHFFYCVWFSAFLCILPSLNKYCLIVSWIASSLTCGYVLPFTLTEGRCYPNWTHCEATYPTGINPSDGCAHALQQANNTHLPGMLF